MTTPRPSRFGDPRRFAGQPVRRVLASRGCPLAWSPSASPLDRLVALGAILTRQGSDGSVLMTDRDGNEFRVLPVG